ncbi:hypothetical protein [Streptomyces sp. NPDC048191]|uniref:MmyB family transcriptional regulator n=1 Tax=Streptomyces sp. NPDC048191 TaxID=3155484 RepID=UPI0033C40C13
MDGGPRGQVTAEPREFGVGRGRGWRHPERSLADLGAARAAVDAVLAGHGPSPALAVSVRRASPAANDAATAFQDGLPPSLCTPPLNVLRATLHPAGLSWRLRDPGQWREHVLRRLRRQPARTATEGLAELLAEIESHPAPAGRATERGTATWSSRCSRHGLR